MKKCVTPDKIRLSTADVPTRDDMIHAEFWFEGDEEIPAGRWKVRQLLHRKNEYRCCRLSDAPAGTPNIDSFDIGYVMRRVHAAREELHERGPAWFSKC